MGSRWSIISPATRERIRNMKKYILPITVFLKPMSYFSLIRIKCDTGKCIGCGK